ncbi:sulfite exporter TauE/SafE family protein [Agrobacterium rubi]|nr:sulfite exporter TauE/SafE family protein [Agrobacterium rubi]
MWRTIDFLDHHRGSNRRWLRRQGSQRHRPSVNCHIFHGVSFRLHHAIAVMTAPVIVSHVWKLVQFIKRSEASFLRPMVCVAILGVVLGALAFSSISGGALTFALGLVLYGYLPVRLIKPGFELDPIGATFGSASWFRFGISPSSDGHICTDHRAFHPCDGL